MLTSRWPRDRVRVPRTRVRRGSRRSARRRRGGTRTRVRRPVDNGTVLRSQRGRVGPKGPGSFRVPARVGRAAVGWDRHGSTAQEDPVRLLARSALAALAGVAAGLAFEPYHWVVLLPFAVAGADPAAPRPHRRLRSGFWLGFVFGTAFMLRAAALAAGDRRLRLDPAGRRRGAVLRARRARPPGPCVRLPGWPVWAARPGCWSRRCAASCRSAASRGAGWRSRPRTPRSPPAFAYVGAAGRHVPAWPCSARPWPGRVLRARRTPVRAVVGVAVAAVAGLPRLAVRRPGEPARADGRGPPSRSPRCRATCRARGSRPSPSGARCSTTTCDATLELAARVDAGTAPRPDLVVWPENSSDIDPYADPQRRARRSAAAAGGRRAAAGGRGRRRPGRPAAGSTGRSSGRPADRRRAAATTRRHPVPFGEYIPLRSLLRRAIPAAATRSPATWSAAPARACCGSGRRRVGDADVLRGRLRRRCCATWSTAAPTLIVVPTNNATYTGTGQIEQQFAMSPAAGDRDRPLGRGRLHQRHLRASSPRTARWSSRRPRARAGGAGAARSRCQHAADPGRAARAPGPSWRCRACRRSRSCCWAAARLSSAAHRTTGGRRPGRPAAATDEPSEHEPAHEHERSRPRRDGRPDLQRARQPGLDRRPGAVARSPTSTCWWSTTAPRTAPASSPTSWPPPTRRSACCTAPRRRGLGAAYLHGFRVALDARLRRGRRDGRRRLPPARAAAAAAGRAARTPTW